MITTRHLRAGMPRLLHPALLLLLLAACGGGGDGLASAPQAIDRSCDTAQFPSSQWTNCEFANYGKTLDAPLEQANPAFQSRVGAQSLANIADWTARAAADPSWLSPMSLNSAALPVCATWGLPCVADPFRYPQAAGADGDAFYQHEATIVPVVFYDRHCARLSGQIWLPTTIAPGVQLPNVVITTGSVQAPATSYWWAAQALVRAGYAVLTYDVRGQGRSDFQAPDLAQGTNANPKVFWEDQVDAIDFFRSSIVQPYPHELHCAGTYPTQTDAYNPVSVRLDRARLGIAGHSLGAIGVSVVQGYGAPGADPWPGLIDSDNPVRAAVAFDSLMAPDGSGFAPVNDYPVPPELANAIVQIGSLGQLPKFAPRAPSLSFNADYGLLPAPYVAPPDPEAHKLTYQVWQAAGVPVYVLGFQGTTHFDFALTPGLPTSSWCPDAASGACTGGWGNPAITRYTVAWFDRWLKLPGEAGHEDADQRLLDDGGALGATRLSFRYRSARDYPDRNGDRRHCEDIRAGCP